MATKSNPLNLTNEAIRTQSAEFDAMTALSKQWQRLTMTAVVDDDYARVRHEWESALVAFTDAMHANGRFDAGSRHAKVAMTVPLAADSSIIQGWAAALGLRHQGVLVSAVRGCDSTEREDRAKFLVRMYRGILLRPHCHDIKKAASFMIPFDEDLWHNTMHDFLRSIDHYPNHWILHFMHACEIVAYKHPDSAVRDGFWDLYKSLVRKFHLLPEPELELDRRLNADEDTFKRGQT